MEYNYTEKISSALSTEAYHKHCGLSQNQSGVSM